jgi:hypothetical protein
VAGVVGHLLGGILGLAHLLNRYGEAVEFDLLGMGLHLDDLGDAWSWHDLWVIVRQLPRTSALARAIHGEAATWGPTEYLLAAAIDALNGANWQRGGRRTGRPKPIPRPTPDKAATTRTWGSGAIPVHEFDAWLAARQEATYGS